MNDSENHSPQSREDDNTTNAVDQNDGVGDLLGMGAID